MVRRHPARGQFITVQSIECSRFMAAAFGQTRWSYGGRHDRATENQRKRTPDSSVRYPSFVTHFLSIWHISKISASPKKKVGSPPLCDQIDGNLFDIRSIGSSDLLPKSGTMVIHLQSVETTDFDLELRHKLAQKCAVKEWMNTDTWFHEMQAKRK